VAGEYKYNFNMQVSARDMTRQNHSARQQDVAFWTGLIFIRRTCAGTSATVVIRPLAVGADSDRRLP
jgi:hypothetical protein